MTIVLILMHSNMQQKQDKQKKVNKSIRKEKLCQVYLSVHTAQVQ